MPTNDSTIKDMITTNNKGEKLIMTKGLRFAFLLFSETSKGSATAMLETYNRTYESAKHLAVHKYDLIGTSAEDNVTVDHMVISDDSVTTLFSIHKQDLAILTQEGGRKITLRTDSTISSLAFHDAETGDVIEELDMVAMGMHQFTGTTPSWKIE